MMIRSRRFELLGILHLILTCLSRRSLKSHFARGNPLERIVGYSEMFYPDCSQIMSNTAAGCPQIAGENRPTRTLSKPDGKCSSGVGQHLVKARHAKLPYNAQCADVRGDASPRLASRESGSSSLGKHPKWLVFANSNHYLGGKSGSH